MWADYREGIIDKEELRTTRFHRANKEFGLVDDALAIQMGDYYIFHSPRKKALFPGTKEILAWLKVSYNLHIITNGFSEVQYIKLEHCGLAQFFDEVIISEQVGVKKPHPYIFKFAVERVGGTVNNSIMIGDNLQVDIAGARNAGMDQVFVNHIHEKHDEEVFCEVHSLEELRPIFS